MVAERRRYTAAVDIAAVYSPLTIAGLQHGPSYRTLTAAWVGEVEVAARLFRRAMLHGTQVHPADLDAGLQLQVLLHEAGVQDEGVPLPFAVDAAMLRGRATGALQATVVRCGPETNDIGLAAQTGGMAQLTGFHIRVLRNSIPSGPRCARLPARWHDVDITALRSGRSHLFPVACPLRRNEVDCVLAARGEGLWLEMDDGSRFLEAGSNLWNVSLGYSCDPIKRAIAEQLDILPYYNVHRGQATSIALHLSNVLCDLLREEGMSRAFFMSGGSEAMDSSMKMCRHVWSVRGRPEKTRFLAFQGAYHGLTYGATALSKTALMHRAGPTLDAIQLQRHDLYRRDDGMTADAFARTALQEIEERIVEKGPESIAAFYADPFSWPHGFPDEPVSYWQGLRTICDRHNILLVIDEIVTGFGRTGTWFAVQQYGIEPDMMVLSKGITGGYYPFAVVMLHHELESCFDSNDSVLVHGHTNCGHPVGCAAAVATIEYIVDEGVLENVNRRGAQLRALLGVLQQHCPHLGDVRGRGLLFCLELVRDREAKRPLQEAIMARLISAAREGGLKMRAAAHMLFLSPMSNINEDELLELVTRLVHAFFSAELLGQAGRAEVVANLQEASRDVADTPAPQAAMLFPKPERLRGASRTSADETVLQPAMRAPQAVAVAMAPSRPTDSSSIVDPGATQMTAALHGLSASQRVAYLHEAVARLAEEVTGYRNLSPDEPLFELAAADSILDGADAGMNSLHAAEFTGRLSELTGCVLPATTAFDYPSIRSLAAHLVELLPTFDPISKPSPIPLPGPIHISSESLNDVLHDGLVIRLRKATSAAAKPTSAVVIAHTVLGDTAAFDGLWKGSLLKHDVFGLLQNPEAAVALKGGYQTVRTLAEKYVSTLLQITAELDFLAMSFGTCLAYEIAILIKERGGRPQRLVLIDPAPTPKPDLPIALPSLYQCAAVYAKWFCGIEPEDLGDDLGDNEADVWSALTRALGDRIGNIGVQYFWSIHRFRSLRLNWAADLDFYHAPRTGNCADVPFCGPDGEAAIFMVFCSEEFTLEAEKETSGEFDRLPQISLRHRFGELAKEMVVQGDHMSVCALLASGSHKEFNQALEDFVNG